MNVKTLILDKNYTVDTIWELQGRKEVKCVLSFNFLIINGGSWRNTLSILWNKKYNFNYNIQQNGIVHVTQSPKFSQQSVNREICKNKLFDLF